MNFQAMEAYAGVIVELHQFSLSAEKAIQYVLGCVLFHIHSDTADSFCRCMSFVIPAKKSFYVYAESDARVEGPACWI